MNTRINAIVFAPLAIAVSASTAAALITGVTGQTTWLTTPPPNSTLGFLNGQNAYVWDEQQNINVTSLGVDMANNPCPSPGFAISGSLSGVHSSHFVHLENLTGLSGGNGTVSFLHPIVGVIFFGLSLDGTDSLLGANGTIYPTALPPRDFSFTPSTFSISGSTMTFNLANAPAIPGVIQARVITAVPTPGGIAIAGVMGLVALRRRRA